MYDPMMRLRRIICASDLPVARGLRLGDRGELRGAAGFRQDEVGGNALGQ